MRSFAATARYEMVMQLRRRAMWITYAIIVGGFYAASPTTWIAFLDDPDPKNAMLGASFTTNLFLLVVYGVLLADRLTRDQVLRVAPLLDVTPGPSATRLVGKYTGACAGAAAPISAVYLGHAAIYSVTNGAPSALVWAAALFGAVAVPAMLFVGAFALAGPLIMPTTVFRVLFVGYWFWGNAQHPRSMPTLSYTLVYPLGGYQLEVFFGGGYQPTNGESATYAGPVTDAVWNLLRPEPTIATATASMTVLLAMAAAAICGAHLLRVRTAAR